MTKQKSNFSTHASVQENRESAMQVSHVGRYILQNSIQKRLDNKTIVLIRKK